MTPFKKQPIFGTVCFTISIWTLMRRSASHLKAILNQAALLIISVSTAVTTILFTATLYGLAVQRVIFHGAATRSFTTLVVLMAGCSLNTTRTQGQPILHTPFSHWR